MNIKEAIREGYELTVRFVWGERSEPLKGPKAWLVNSLRFLHRLAQEYSEGQLNLRAMSLVYTTILSIVPLLAVSFSVLKAFGIQDIIQPIVSDFLAPLGERGGEITDRVFGYVGNVNAGVLGTAGLALLVYSVISVIHKVELSLNYIWRVDKPRPLARRFSDYMSVLFVGPIFIAASISITSALMSESVVLKLKDTWAVGFVFFAVGEYLPYILTGAVFTFMYIVMPSTKVRFTSGLVGGILAGVLWQSAGWGFAAFVVGSPKYNAIYSGFAILIVFMIWLYVSWLILLVGALASFYYQNPQYLLVKKREAVRLAGRLREKLALSIMYLIGKSHREGTERWNLSGLVSRLAIPIEPVQEMARILEKRGLIVETGDDPPTYLPAKDISSISLGEIVECTRSGVGGYRPSETAETSIDQVAVVMRGIDESVDASLGNRTLLSMIEG